MNFSRNIEPLYIKHSDIKLCVTPKLLPISLCREINNLVPNSLIGVQQYFGIWRVYMTNRTARLNLLASSLKLVNKIIAIYDSNPFENNTKRQERILIKDLPFSITDQQLCDYLNAFKQVNLQSEILYGKIYNEDNGLSKYNNGDRFVYAKGDIIPPLPYDCEIDGHRIRVLHKSQKYKCNRCGFSDHKVDDVDNCNAYVNSQPITTFKYPSDILSNFHMCSINYKDSVYPSAEHCYQFIKCNFLIQNDVAEKVMSARTASEAKEIADHYITDKIDLDIWKTTNVDIMKEILEAKAASYEPFRKALIDSKNDLLVEATLDKFWGAGMNAEYIKHTKKGHFKGSNKLGELLMDIRKELKNPSESTLFNEDDTITQQPSPSKVVDSKVVDSTLGSKPQSLKRRNSSNQEAGPNPPGTPGAASSKSVHCDQTKCDPSVLLDDATLTVI